MLQNLPILPKNELFYVKTDKTTNESKVEQLYRVDMKMPLIIEQIGWILNGEFIDQRNTPIVSQRRRNLFDLKLKASMVITNNDTLNHLTDYR